MKNNKIKKNKDNNKNKNKNIVFNYCHTRLKKK